MGTPIRVLLIEDSEDDALLLLRELQRGGYEPAGERVDSAAALTAALTRQEWDLITCDWVMPHLNAPTALQLIEHSGCDAPIIIVSGEVGEEVAVTAMKAGAHDYVNKHKLARLVPAIERELREVENRRARKHAEQALRTSERMYRDLVETSHDLIWAMDTEGRYTFVNQAAQSLLGYEVREMIGRPFTAFLNPDDRQAALEIFARIKAAGRFSYRFEFARRDGRAVIVRTNATVVRDTHGTTIGVTGTTTDITERVRAADALQRSERHFRSLIENGSDLIAILGNDGIIRYASPSHTRVLGYQPEELVGRHAFDFVHPDDLPPLLATFQCAVAEIGAAHSAEFRFRHQDGSWRRLEGIAKNALDDSVVAGVIVNSRDVSERKRAEEELRLTRDRLRTYIDQANDLIFTLDPQGRIASVNSAVSETTGYSPEELLGTAPVQLVVPEARAAVATALRRVLSGDTIEQLDIEVVSKDGRRITLEVRGRTIREGDHVAETFHIARDVTERRRAEAELRQAQKLEAIGRLAGGVAHDFNNQLTIIKGCAQFVLSGLPPDDQRYQDVQRITETVDRGARLVRQLLTFSRLGPVEPQSLNLADLITEMTPMLGLLLGEQITLRVQCGPGLWAIRADRSQVEQVLMNLVGNARDALSHEGERTGSETVTIEAANVELDRWAHGLPEGVRPGLYVALVVGDNGPGMPTEVRDHIFEPFFTTKDFGEGTGLGLATVYGIVKQHGGYVACASELGRGTRFEIYLPRGDTGAAQSVAEPEAAAWQGQASARQERTVLVAEDDESVREVLVRALGESGYRAYGATQSDDALAVAARVDGRIDLLVTDVVMPGGNGYALARRLRESHPDLCVLFVSGYYADPLELTDAPQVRFLRKPFGLDELLQTVAEMLLG
jgi:PAS domain S-box-containing protein